MNVITYWFTYLVTIIRYRKIYQFTKYVNLLEVISNNYLGIAHSLITPSNHPKITLLFLT